MDNPNCKGANPEKAIRTFCSASLLALLIACGGSGGSTGLEEPITANSAPQADPTVSASGEHAGNNPSEFTPSLGIQVDHDSEASINPTDTTYIEAQWLHMQNCLQLSAAEPSVLVVDGKITPEDANDDVLRHIDGQIQASAHVTDTGASIQIRAADFDGSLGEPGSYLRSIIGRYLWLSSGLPERAYDYDCANTVP